MLARPLLLCCRSMKTKARAGSVGGIAGPGGITPGLWEQRRSSSPVRDRAVVAAARYDADRPGCRRQRELASDNRAFAVSLYQTLRASAGSDDNLVFSPTSISIALAMLYNGAANDTATADRHRPRLHAPRRSLERRLRCRRSGAHHAARGGRCGDVPALAGRLDLGAAGLLLLAALSSTRWRPTTAPASTWSTSRRLPRAPGRPSTAGSPIETQGVIPMLLPMGSDRCHHQAGAGERRLLPWRLGDAVRGQQSERNLPRRRPAT